jgi:hypothetical protein
MAKNKKPQVVNAQTQILSNIGITARNVEV